MKRTGPKKRKHLKPWSPEAAGAGLRVPFLAIVGRPNVGKSTLFNRLMGRRIAIVEKTAGTTRDRVSAVLELPDGRRCELCDMGGLGGTEDPFDKDVDRQIRAAMSMADAILFLVDSRERQNPLDKTIAQRVLRLGKPVLLVANKAETKELELLSSELAALGCGDPLPISAREGAGRTELLERLAKFVPHLEGVSGGAPATDSSSDEEEEEAEAEAPPTAVERREALRREDHDHELRVAIVGRRNAGKSSYVNALFGDERVIVSATPGTTRDAVDVRVLVDGEPVVLIDTAGLRKRGRADDYIELISHSRAMDAVRRADVAIVLLDSLRDVAEVDKKICELAVGEFKALVIVASKWDLVGDRMSVDQFAEYVRKKMPSISFVPVVAMSSQTGFNVKSPVAIARELYAQSRERVSTAQLNRVLHDAFARRRPRKKRHLEAKLYFGTQIRTNPVTIVLFVNKPTLFDADYLRYLSAELRASLPWGEIPLKLVIRERRGLLERGVSRAERDERRLARQLEKTREWLENEDAVPLEEVAAELDKEEVKAALAAELAAEEAEEAARNAPTFGTKREVDVVAEDEDEDEEADESDETPPSQDLLFGEDADVVRRRRARKKRRGR